MGRGNALVDHEDLLAKLTREKYRPLQKSFLRLNICANSLLARSDVSGTFHGPKTVNSSPSSLNGRPFGGMSPTKRPKSLISKNLDPDISAPREDTASTVQSARIPSQQRYGRKMT